MYYWPTIREMVRFWRKLPDGPLREALEKRPIRFGMPLPMTSEREARAYLTEKIARYQGRLPFKGRSIAAQVEDCIAKSMNSIKAVGFTYLNLYVDAGYCIGDPHVAAAIAFPFLAQLPNELDDIDLQYGFRKLK